MFRQAHLCKLLPQNWIRDAKMRSAQLRRTAAPRPRWAPRGRGLELGDVVAERRGGVVGGGAWFLLTWMRMDEAAATVMRTSPPAMAAVFLAPSSDVPAVPELMALSATYTVGCMRVSVSPQNQSAAVRCYHLISFKKKRRGPARASNQTRSRRVGIAAVLASTE
jgi:hypothetical protein